MVVLVLVLTSCPVLVVTPGHSSLQADPRLVPLSVSGSTSYLQPVVAAVVPTASLADQYSGRQRSRPVLLGRRS
jgi:hypothetical protein